MGRRNIKQKQIRDRDIDTIQTEITERYNKYTQGEYEKTDKSESLEEFLNNNSGRLRLDAVYASISAQVLEKYKHGVETSFDLGPVYKAMEAGVPLIIDEFNALPAEAQIAINHLYTRKAGMEVSVQENGGKLIKVKEGFSFVFTGNVGSQYAGRSKIESSVKDRVSHIVQYDYLPNASGVGDTIESSASQSEGWQLMLSALMDKSGTMSIPDGDADELWRMSKAIRYCQDIATGKVTDITVPGVDGNTVSASEIADILKDAPLSMRIVLDLLDDYKHDNKAYTFEYLFLKKYLKEKLSLENDKMVIHVYLELFKKFGFYKNNAGNGYTITKNTNKESVINIDLVDSNTGAEAAKRVEVKNKVYNIQDVAELAFGKMPELSQDKRNGNKNTKGMKSILEEEVKKRLVASTNPKDLERLEKEKAERELKERLETQRLENIKNNTEFLSGKFTDLYDTLDQVVKNNEVLKKVEQFIEAEIKKKVVSKEVKTKYKPENVTTIGQSVLANKKIIDKLIKNYGDRDGVTNKAEELIDVLTGDIKDDAAQVTSELDASIKILDTILTLQGTLLDKHKPDSPKIQNIIQTLKSTGHLDSTFENKDFHSIEMKPQSRQEALLRYENSGGKTWVWQTLKIEMPYTTQKPKNLDVLALQFLDPFKRTSENIAEWMKDNNLRPLTYEEHIEYITTHPEHQKKNPLISLGTKHLLGGVLHVPGASWDVSRRFLDAFLWASVWNAVNRFLAAPISS